MPVSVELRIYRADPGWERSLVLFEAITSCANEELRKLESRHISQMAEATMRLPPAIAIGHDAHGAKMEDG
jgi:hypothetical protein